MGQLLDSIRTLFSGVSEMKILMVGLDAAGKTTILYKLQLGETVHTIPTVGFNVESVTFNKNRITVWDVGGQSKIIPLWRHYFQNSDAVIFVVDSADETRFEQARNELATLFGNDELRDAAYLIYANKQDLPQAVAPERIIDAFGLRNERRHPWFVQGCCATTGDGLFEGLEWVTRQVRDIRTRRR